MKIKLIIEVDDEFIDEYDPTGMTEEGFNTVCDAVMEFGSIVSGPDRVS